MNNNSVLKGMLIALVALYVISPLDFAPGPVDDLLLMLFTAAVNSAKNSRARELPEPDSLEKFREKSG